MNCEKLHDLGLQIARELGAQPLYVLEHPAELPIPEGVGAYAKAGTNWPLFDIIKERGQWRGPGPQIVFVETQCPDEILTATFIHELGHVLPAFPIPDSEPTDAARAEDQQELAAWAADPSDKEDSKPLWFPNHGKDFVRIALHLWWRAALAGIVLPYHMLCAGSRYDLSAVYFYLLALGGEPMKMREATFAEILASEPPAAFTQLWKHDLRTWLDRHPEIKEQFA